MMDIDADKIRDQIAAVEDAADEARSNVDRLARYAPTQEVIEYLRGDAYELEQRADRLVQNLRAVADDAEEVLDPEPPLTPEEKAADKAIGGDGPPALKARFNI